jgi:hypothetical protein
MVNSNVRFSSELNCSFGKKSPITAEPSNALAFSQGNPFAFSLVVNP